MNEIVILPSFEKRAKKLLKKFHSLKNELSEFITLTEKNGIQGTDLGNGIFKARLAIKSKGKGKSGGLRVISYREVVISVSNGIIFFVAIYDKSEIANLTKAQIEKILKDEGLI